MKEQDSVFSSNFSLNLKGQLFDLSTPVVMGILNLSKDSFYDGGRFSEIDQALKHCEKMLLDGASIIDIGAASTRPGAKIISPEKQLEMLLAFLDKAKISFPQAIFSVDTVHAEVAKQCVEHAAHIVNDISGGQIDPNMFSTVAKLKVPYVLSHIKGKPENMQESPSYENVVKEVAFYFAENIDRLINLGVKDIIIDPGFGFGKTLEHNYDLLENLTYFKMLERSIMVGISRKSMVYKALNISSEQALNGSTALHMVALQKGAKILRVHDVREAMECIKLYQLLKADEA